MNTDRWYQLHDCVVHLDTPSAAWADSVDEILGPYRCDDATPDIHARLGPGSFDDLSAGEVLAHFDDLVFHAGRDDTLWIDVHGRGWVHIDPAASRLEVRVDLDPVDDGWVVAHHALYPALLELLKERGMFPVHAGAVSRSGEGALLCGVSGSGKTTLTLALAAAGWKLLSDDTCFLTQANEGIDCLAFWEDLHVTQETIDRFPQLEFLNQQPLRKANRKKHFGAADLDGVGLAERTRPRWLLFPRVAGGSTELRALKGREALERMTPQSLIPLRAALTERHLAHLTALVQQVECLDLAMGPDLDEVVRVVHEHFTK